MILVKFLFYVLIIINIFFIPFYVISFVFFIIILVAIKRNIKFNVRRFSWSGNSKAKVAREIKKSKREIKEELTRSLEKIVYLEKIVKDYEEEIGTKDQILYDIEENNQKINLFLEELISEIKPINIFWYKTNLKIGNKG